MTDMMDLPCRITWCIDLSYMKDPKLIEMTTSNHLNHVNYFLQSNMSKDSLDDITLFA